ncbi:MAG: triose-phosphate isomerase, partial [Neisseria elongata]
MWDKKWVIGNWKMNGRLQNNNALVHKLRSMPVQQKVCIGIAPPTVYLSQVHNAVAPGDLGMGDLPDHARGRRTVVPQPA